MARYGFKPFNRYFSTGLGRSTLPPDFTLLPGFFSLPEQRILLETALQQLDARESKLMRRRRQQFDPSRASQAGSSVLQSMFYPDQYYDFEEGHYDGVIRNFREIHLTSWPKSVVGLGSILDRLHSLIPSPDIQTHLLHLASGGEILPHVDNLDASGSWILGVSLGNERILRLEGPAEEDHCTFEVPLYSGSVYIQKGQLRYSYKHSVCKDVPFEGRRIRGGQRVSIMIRDLPRRSA